jgi:hypothetical protein
MRKSIDKTPKIISGWNKIFGYLDKEANKRDFPIIKSKRIKK